LPDEFPTEEEQNKERERLFDILTELVKWENSNNKTVLDAAKAEIMKSTNGNPPPLLDPFAGGGAIPLEAQRLGLEVHASDINPVAVMINKAMIEIPPKFAGQPPVNPESRGLAKTWDGAQGLADDVRYYGEWMKQKAFEKIGHLYPKVKDENGEEHTVIAWIWARTVKCPNPACGCEMPLVGSFELSKKKGREAYIQPVVDMGSAHGIRYEVRYGKEVPEETVGRSGARCFCCNTPVSLEHIRSEAKVKRMHSHLMAIVSESSSGRLYFSPSKEHICIAQCNEPSDVPNSDLPQKALGFRVQNYGLSQHKDLFTNRQLTALTTFSNLITEAQSRVKEEGGSDEYAQAVGVYLAFSVDSAANAWSLLVGWRNTVEASRNTFSRQALQMVWDFAEINPFSNSCGNWSDACVGWTYKSINCLCGTACGKAYQQDAQIDNGMRGIFVSTDPPYYDNIGYADLSDFFYTWLRLSLKKTYPELFRTVLVPKDEELIANPFKFDDGAKEARAFFEKGMRKVFQQINLYATEAVPVTVYYAFKQSDSEDEQSASPGWETMLAALIQAGFAVAGTWPVRTEKPGRMRGIDSNALASSIVLVCRKRSIDAPTTTRRDFVNTLKRDLKPALQKLQASNIAPVDLAQSAIGPGMGVYSRFSQVLEADGTPMSVRAALQIINQELDLYFNEQDGELDRDSRFCVDLYTQHAFNDMKFGEADVLARAKNTSVEKLVGCGVLHAEKGVVRLLTREEITEKEKTGERIVWLLCQQLTRALEKDGVVGAAQIITDIFTSEPEHAKALAYRLFQIAERKGWANEAYAYNSLVIAWPEVQAKAAELQSQKSDAKQMTIFDLKEEN
jgi:putative DNA methylase